MTLSQEEAEAPKPLVAPFAIAQPSASRAEPAAPIPGAPWAGMPAPEVPMFDDPETVDTLHRGAVLRTLDLERHVVAEDAELQTIDIEIVDDEDEDSGRVSAPAGHGPHGPARTQGASPPTAPTGHGPERTQGASPPTAPMGPTLQSGGTSIQASTEPTPAPAVAPAPVPEPATKESWSWATVAPPSERSPAPPPSRPAPIPKPPVRNSLYGKFSNKKK